MQFQNPTALDTIGHNYNVKYNPLYGLTSPYLTSRTYAAATSRASYGHLFAPLAAGMISDIDFTRPYLNKDLDPITGMFAHKSLFSKARIEGLVADMAVRYDMMRRNITALDYKVCEVDSRLMQLPPFQIEWGKDLDRTRTALEQTVIDLEREKMRERTTAWRDINRVRSELMESLAEYSGAHGAAAFLDSYGGGLDY